MWGHHKKRGLRNWVVMILRRGPKTGAQIMDEMELMTRGWWRPSPGSVYPLLEEMVSEKMLRRNEDGSYELTESATREAGWSFMTAPRTPKEVVQELSGLASYLEDLARKEKGADEIASNELRDVVRRLDRLSK